MTRRERRVRFAVALSSGLAVTAVAAAPAAWGADDRSDAEALWARSQRDWLPRLGAALESVPGTGTTPWADAAAGLSGRITVFPADPGNCRRFRIELSGAEGALDGSGVRCRDGGGVWLATAEPDRVVLRRAAADPGVLALQRDLGRLRYYDGAVDGVPSAALVAASRAFAADEGMPPDATPPVLRDRAAAAVARIPGGTGCPGMNGVAVPLVACARVR